MDQKFISQIQSKLEDKITELQAIKDRHSDQLQKKLPQDSGEATAHHQNKDLAELKRDHEVEEIEMIQKALGRIETGTFGQCIACGEDINIERLKAIPYAEHCIECQEKLDEEAHGG